MCTVKVLGVGPSVYCEGIGGGAQCVLWRCWGWGPVCTVRWWGWGPVCTVHVEVVGVIRGGAQCVLWIEVMGVGPSYAASKCVYCYS